MHARRPPTLEDTFSVTVAYEWKFCEQFLRFFGKKQPLLNCRYCASVFTDKSFTRNRVTKTIPANKTTSKYVRISGLYIRLCKHLSVIATDHTD